MTVSAFMTNKKTSHFGRSASGTRCVWSRSGDAPAPLVRPGPAPGARCESHLAQSSHTWGQASRSAPRGLVLLEELLEQGAVVDHRRPQILGRRVAALVRNRDPVRGAVVRDHLGMVDREVVRALVEILDRVAAVTHHLLDQ